MKLLHATRVLDFDPPLTGRVKRISRSVCDALGARRCRTRRPSPAVVEFDGPGVGHSGLSLRRIAAGLIEGGTVTLLPDQGQIRLELRYDVVWTLAVPCILLYVFAFGTPPLFALSAAALIVVPWALACIVAGSTFATWVRDAARREDRP